MIVAKLDSKYRLVVPKNEREKNDLEVGDLFVLQEDTEAGTITFVKLENELLKRIAEGEADYRAGRTRSLDDVAAELGIDLERE